MLGDSAWWRSRRGSSLRASSLTSSNRSMEISQLSRNTLIMRYKNSSQTIDSRKAICKTLILRSGKDLTTRTRRRRFLMMSGVRDPYRHIPGPLRSALTRIQGFLQLLFRTLRKRTERVKQVATLHLAVRSLPMVDDQTRAFQRHVS